MQKNLETVMTGDSVHEAANAQFIKVSAMLAGESSEGSADATKNGRVVLKDNMAKIAKAHPAMINSWRKCLDTFKLETTLTKKTHYD
eukprot:COSAG02_NODE_10635_length_1893_cov_24.591416_2_plen_86_part_01